MTQPAPADHLVVSRPPDPAPTREDPVARALSALVGGPAGRRATAYRSVQRAGAVLAVIAVALVGLGVVQKQHCRAEGWTSPQQFFHTCYSDLPVVYESSGLADGVAPYVQSSRGRFLEQPLLTGLVSWGLAVLVPGAETSGTSLDQAATVSAREQRDRDRTYFDLAAVLVALLVAGLVLVTVRSAGHRPWDAAHVALNPLLALSALVALDPLGVLLASGGLLAWSRRRHVVSGLLIGLAIGARTYPLLLLVAVGLLAARAGQLRAWTVTAGTALAMWLGATLPWFLLSRDGVMATYAAWWRSSAGYGSPWLVPQLLGRPKQLVWERWLGLDGTAIPAGAVTALAVVGLVLAVACGVAVALGAPQRPRLAQVALIVLGVALLTGKALPVQSSLWLLPLAALAVPRWRDHLVWIGCEVVYFVGVWLYVASGSVPDRGLPARFYAVLLVVRLAGIAWLVVMAWREAWRPGRDPVRVTGEDDPLGGVLSGAPDQLVVRVGD